MKRLILLAALVLPVLILGGCSNGATTRVQNQVSGNVFDLNGDPVRGARVFHAGAGDQITFSNSSGAYILQDLPDGDILVEADITKDGIRYYGANVARVFDGERSQSVDLHMGRADQQATLQGVVVDRFGNSVFGARIFANSGGGLGSTLAITGEDGSFRLVGLHGGVQYRIFASGPGFNSDTDTITFGPGEEATQNYVLKNPTDTLLPAPQNLSVTIWTSPREVTTAPDQRRAIEAFKTMYDKRRLRKQGFGKNGAKLSNGGNWIEADLFWDAIDDEAVLGYGIYRGTSQNGATTAIDFLRDPLSGFFADTDPGVRQNTNYYYEITALNVLYPDTGNSESDFSDRYGVRALGDLNVLSPTFDPLTFRWQGGSGAQSYVVFVFDELPGIGVESLWPGNDPNEVAQATTTGTSLVYQGPPLVEGRRYYFLVLGLANNNDSRTVSRITQFTFTQN